MGDSAFPGQHTTTTTTVRMSNTNVQTNLVFDPRYIRTKSGMLKVAQVLLSLIGFICIEASGVYRHHSRGAWFVFVSQTAFWFTGVLLVFYLFHVIERLYKIPWLKIEFVFCGIWTLFYLIASALAVNMYVEAYEAAGFFGFCAMVAYGLDCFLKLRAIKAGELAQGERVVSQETTTTVKY